MDVWNWIQLGLTIIGGATILLNAIAPLTKSTKDDKILAFLKAVLAAVSLNVNDKTLGIKTNKLDINIKGK